MTKFAVNHHLRGMTLVDQLVERMRRAIAAGQFKENERLPGIREMADLAGVSEKVSRTAFRRLAEQGWVVTRPHVGSVVAKGAAELNVRGRVLIFNPDTSYGYYSSLLLSTLHHVLIGKGFRLTAISGASAALPGRYVELENLLRERWSLVLEFGMEPRSRNLIEESGWPFVIVGSGGVVCEKPAGSTATVANVLDLPFEAEVVPQAWTIPSGVSLQVKKPMSGAAIADYAISISGGGKLTLDADSPDLEPPLDLDNLDLYVNTSYALGSTNRFTKIKTPAGTRLHFGWGLKNYVPIDLSAYGTVNYFGDFGRGYEQAGAAKLNLMQNLCNGYTFSGGLVGSGQYYTIGIYSYTISGKPMAMPNGSIYNDATTLNLKSTGNVFGQIYQVNGSTKCQTANALCATGKFTFGRLNTGYTTGTLDLGGFDQDIGAIYNGATATAGDTTIYGTISSAKPATLTSHDATSRTVAMKFTGYAGYAHAGSGTYTFLNFANTATNTLSVLAGGVTLKSGAGFPNAKAVHVASGATLTVDKTSEEVAFGSAGKSRAVTTIEEGGTLALTDGAEVTVRRLCVGEKGMEPTVYTAGDPANPWLTGSGSVRVLQPWKPGILLIVR